MRRNAPPAGVDLREREQLAYLDQIVPLLPERWSRYRPGNDQFGAADAGLYAAILRWERPRHVVEVGSGWSTAVAVDCHERWLPNLEITCIEPYTARLRSSLRPGDALDIREEQVQDTPSGVFGSLGAGDILFVDSTHVAKAGSDVQRLVLEILPSMPVGALIHFHDIFWPFEYPKPWLAEGRGWNEAYLLHAFLAHNVSWQIILWESWVWVLHPELVPESLRAAPGPGGIWLRRVS